MKSQISNTPKLRFPDFKDQWKIYPFGEIFTMINTNSFSRAMLNYESGSVKNIHYGDIHTKFNSNFDITKENVPFLNEEIEVNKIAEGSYCKAGDLVIADASEDYKDVGRSIEIINTGDQKLVAGLHTYIARDLKNLCALGFKGYLMQTRNIRLQIMELATGVSVLSISKGNIVNLKLNLPSLPEQQKIASFLTSVDTKIQQLTKKKTLLEQYKKGVMQKIFNQEIRFKDENGKEFPKWKKMRIEDVSMIKKGEQLNSSELTLSGQYPCLNGGIRPSGYTDKWNTDKNTITISEGGNSCGYVNYITEKFWCGGHCYALKELSDKINPQYLFQVLKYNEVSIMRLRVGSGLPNIQKKDLSSFEIFMPEKGEQVKISNFLSALDRKIDYSNILLEKTKLWKKGLLQQLFV